MSLTRLVPTQVASASSSTTHGRFVAVHRPSITGPATPTHAASIVAPGPSDKKLADRVGEGGEALARQDPFADDRERAAP